MEVAVEPDDERGDHSHDHQQHSDSQDPRHRIRPVHDVKLLVFTSLDAPKEAARAIGRGATNFMILDALFFIPASLQDE